MNCFISNKKNYPVLSERHSDVLKEFMKIQCRFILAPRHPNDVMENHLKYLSHLFSKHDELDEEDRAEVNYRNYLQSPL